MVPALADAVVSVREGRLIRHTEFALQKFDRNPTLIAAH
jgi:hypothetical protein